MNENLLDKIVEASPHCEPKPTPAGVAVTYQPVTRRLASLSNDELNQLFVSRATKVTEHVTGDGKSAPASILMNLQWNLYEVLLEIQSRYNRNDVRSQRLLPVVEPK